MKTKALILALLLTTTVATQGVSAKSQIVRPGINSYGLSIDYESKLSSRSSWIATVASSSPYIGFGIRNYSTRNFTELYWGYGAYYQGIGSNQSVAAPYAEAGWGFRLDSKWSIGLGAQISYELGHKSGIAGDVKLNAGYAF